MGRHERTRQVKTKKGREEPDMEKKKGRQEAGYLRKKGEAEREEKKDLAKPCRNGP